jgi:peptidoglycan hydrolase-like protein with peptidoglycan-binding domain
VAILCPAGVRCRAEINQRWPRRDKRSDGWIGDRRHRAESHSDHNPNGRGVVDALDIDVDGIDVPFVIACLIRHPATHYVIFNRVIYSRERGFKGARYTGSDPHTNHIHWSCLQTVAAENNLRPWGITTGFIPVPVVHPTPAPTSAGWVAHLAAALPVLRTSPARTMMNRRLQTLLVVAGNTVAVDATFGPRTGTALQHFQLAHHLTANGVCAAGTWGQLMGALPAQRQGSHDAGNVRRVQGLTNLFQVAPHLDMDGSFGPATTRAVRAFQTRYGLHVDGSCGPATYTALMTR